MTTALENAREAYRRHDWVSAYDSFHAAREQAALAVDDLVMLADAAWWLGRTDETLALTDEIYRYRLDRGEVAPAARLAMEIGFLSYLRGDVAVGSGWIGRARRLLRDEPETVEQGYLLSIEVDEALSTGDFETAIARARRVQSIADLFRDPTLSAVGLVGEGTALVKQGRVSEGLSLLDEAMLPVMAGQVEPSFAGNLYCQLMQLCHELADLPRARRWTEATERWCAGFPAAVMFAGICRVHRAQLLRVAGDWGEAQRQAAQACADLATMNVSVVAEGQYQLGEICRLRDDRAGAESAYRLAHELGRDPQPGLALLRLAQGRVEAAAAAVRTALAAQVADRLARARLLAAQVEITLVEGDLATARAASDELTNIASGYPGFVASARQAAGAVLLATDQPGEALPTLRDASRRWQAVDAPYELARVRVLLARAYTALADPDAADRELDLAAAVFDTLGAVADAREVARLRPRAALPDGLTEREAQVLARVAAGASNREIAATLVISEKTVARHLSNIFTKINVSSRTEAAAYAFTHGLVDG